MSSKYTDNNDSEKRLEEIDAYFDEIKNKRLKKRNDNSQYDGYTDKDIPKTIYTQNNDYHSKNSLSTNVNDSEKEIKVKNMVNNKKSKKRKKKKLNIKKFLLFCFMLCFLFAIGLTAYVASIIINTPKIDPNNIYDYLNESSVMYDDQGNVINNIFSKDSGIRKNIEYSDLPENVVNAFVSLEDKTFFKHHGFNIIRIFGAIKDSFSSGKIGGTSTITQQLARNIYLVDSMHSRDIKRKIKEAYYTVILEKHLTKEQILEAYLNTISLGYNSFGVEAASQAYFGKKIGDLDLTESVALASLPQAPFKYALIKKYHSEDISDPNDPNILFKKDDFYYVYNNISNDRRKLCLKLMYEQDKITKSEYETALSDDLRKHLSNKPNLSLEVSSYFVDYVMDDVLNSLVSETGRTEEEAYELLYSGGLKIYTTMNSKIQSLAESEFEQASNFPTVANLKKDSSGNIITSSGHIRLYNINTYFDNAGGFLLNENEYSRRPDGSLVIYKGHRLNIYKTNINNNIDYNLEFKNLYTYSNNIFHSINGGVVAIPAKYKTKDSSGNLVISPKIFTDDDAPDVFSRKNEGLYISPKYITLRQKTIQPQSAMVITDPYNGFIKAMVGGRNTKGRLLFNRATSPRQPGSSIKPIGVYAPALQASVDALNSGTTLSFNDKSGVASLFGDYFTAATVIDDTPLSLKGKPWPKNWYRSYKGLTTFRESVEQSINVSAVRIMQQLGVDKSVKFLKKVGISSIVESGATNDLNAASLALGGMTQGISPLEMSSSYSAFVNDGKYTKPISFIKITNRNDEILLENTPETIQAMDPGVAFIMRDILRSVVTSGTGGRASVPNQPTCGKTGTTNDNHDYWFVGFTPQYSAAVWIGNDVNVSLSQGSLASAKLWGKVMKKVCAGIPTASYHPAPSNVINTVVDSKSGKIPTELSSLDPRGTIRTEYFIKGTQPKTDDNIHAYALVCSDTGYLATPDCPFVKRVSGIKRPYKVNPIVADYKYEIPHCYCPIHNNNKSKYPICSDGVSSYKFEGSTIKTEKNDDEDDINNENKDSNDPNNDPNQNNNIINNNQQSENNSNKNNNSNQQKKDTPPDWLLP